MRHSRTPTHRFDRQRTERLTERQMSEIELHPPSEAERARWPASVIVPLETPFADERGAIQPLVDLPMARWE